MLACGSSQGDRQTARAVCTTEAFQTWQNAPFTPPQIGGIVADGDFDEEVEELELEEDEDELEVDPDDEIDLVEDDEVPVDEIIEADESAESVTDEAEEEFDREDDVEEPLDKILEQRTASGGLIPDESSSDDEDADAQLDGDDRTLAADGVSPKKPGEFTCMSCFLVKHPSQLADQKQMLCRDCV
ncbi:MAG: hypothetical protein DCC49_01260 [Acidobacteria bacterium]|nr:MAG: hypothetical protein DCC49_01260 [Acidobacteriota bacterium]